MPHLQGVKGFWEAFNHGSTDRTVHAGVADAHRRAAPTSCLPARCRRPHARTKIVEFLLHEWLAPCVSMCAKFGHCFLKSVGREDGTSTDKRIARVIADMKMALTCVFGLVGFLFLLERQLSCDFEYTVSPRQVATAACGTNLILTTTVGKHRWTHLGRVRAVHFVTQYAICVRQAYDTQQYVNCGSKHRCHTVSSPLINSWYLVPLVWLTSGCGSGVLEDSYVALAEKKTEETRVTLLQQLRAPESHFGDSVETPEDARGNGKARGRRGTKHHVGRSGGRNSLNMAREVSEVHTKMHQRRCRTRMERKEKREELFDEKTW